MNELELVDSCGIAFCDYHKHLPKLARDFPLPHRVKDRKVLGEYRLRFDACQVCGATRRMWGGEPVWLEIHHIIGGTQGRSDEPTNLILLCKREHVQVKTTALPQSRILYCKWLTDRENVSWVRLAILARKHLPTPEP